MSMGCPWVAMYVMTFIAMFLLTWLANLSGKLSGGERSIRVVLELARPAPASVAANKPGN